MVISTSLLCVFATCAILAFDRNPVDPSKANVGTHDYPKSESLTLVHKSHAFRSITSNDKKHPDQICKQETGNPASEWQMNSTVTEDSPGDICAGNIVCSLGNNEHMVLFDKPSIGTQCKKALNDGHFYGCYREECMKFPKIGGNREALDATTEVNSGETEEDKVTHS